MLALCVTGCFSDRGTVIRVDVGDTGAISVELYLGTEPCSGEDSTKLACMGIAPPPGTSAPLPGEVWFRDAPLPYAAEVKGSTATFQLQADIPRMVPIAIAVGLMPDGTTGVGTATITKLPVGDARIVEVKLTRATRISSGEVLHEGEDRVQVWRNASSSCMVVEHGTSGMPDRIFVVPASDPDCDDVPALECNPAAWHGTRLAGTSPTPDCFVSSSACVLGSRGCLDDEPQNKTSCAAQVDQRVCVPSTFCDGTSCGRFDEPCLRILLASDALPHIDCDVPTLQTPALDLCPEHSATINLDTQFQGGQCDRQPTISSLSPTEPDTNANFGGAIMELESPHPTCQFDIQWKSGTRSLLAGSTDYGLIKLPAREGALLIPIVFRFYPGTCGVQPFHCTIKGSLSDSLWSCAP